MARLRSARTIRVLDVVVGGVGIGLAVGAAVVVVVLGLGGTWTEVREGFFLAGLAALVVGALATRPKRGRQPTGHEEPADRGEEPADYGEGTDDHDESQAQHDEGTAPTLLTRPIARIVLGTEPPRGGQYSTGARLLVAGVVLQATAIAPVGPG